MSHNIMLAEIRSVRFLCFQWHVSFHVMWKLGESNRVADCLPMSTSALFQLSLHLPGVSCFRKLFTAPELPKMPASLFLSHFGDYCNYYLLILVLGGEPAVLFVWEHTWFWSSHGAPEHRDDVLWIRVMSNMAGTNSLLHPCWHVLVCCKDELSGSCSKRSSCFPLCLATHVGLVFKCNG